MVSGVLIEQCKRFSGCRLAVDVNDIVCVTRGYKSQPIYIIAELCQCAESIDLPDYRSNGPPGIPGCERGHITIPAALRKK